MSESEAAESTPQAEAGTQDGSDAGTSKVAARVFPCEGCGADLEFHIGVQSLKCPYCGFVKPFEIPEGEAVAEQDFGEMLERIAQRRLDAKSDEAGFSEVACISCGSKVRFVGTLTSSECAYCGVPLQLDGVHDAEHRAPVDGVLPFLLNREKARKNLGDWVRTRWFAPNEFKKRGIGGRFNGVYLPYWTFDSLTANRYTGMRGIYYYVTVGSGKSRRTVRRTRWYPASGSFQRFFDDVLIVAASGLPEKRLDALHPWPLAKCVPFSQEILAGFLARTYDVPLRDGFELAKRIITDQIEADVRQRIGGDTQRIHGIDTRYDAVTYKHLLLPVWMLAYRYGKKSFQVVVNAGTGEVQGDRPYSWMKITLAVLGGLGLVASIGFAISQMQ